MTTSLRAFRVSLYEEHLEEASFLYAQRRALLSSEQMTWVRIADFEARLEAHIDALVVGGDLALEVCRSRAKEGDFGEVYAAVCVFCRQTRANLLSEVLQNLDCADKEKGTALADALKYELPQQWAIYIEQAIARQDARLTEMLATVCGFRRLPIGPLLHQALAANLDAPSTSIVWALGRIKAHEAQAALAACLQQANKSSTKSLALQALLSLGEQDILRQSYLISQRETWPHLALGLGGNRSAARLLRESIKSGKGTSDSLLALGLLGDLSTVRSLCEYLANPTVAESAALALNWITGANLYEEVFVPEPVEEGELFGRELTAWRERKEVPKGADGKPFGTTVKRLSQNQETWSQWLTQHASHFDPAFRYRNGKLYSPSCLLENLASEQSPYMLRRFACEELFIRYNCEIAFEIDMPVAEQFHKLREMSEWVNNSTGALQSGRWYFAGRVME